MDEKNVLISTLRCIFALSFLIRYTHAACADDTNGLKKFGSDCKYMCHCKNATEQCHDTDGTCTTSGCANAWMGPGCQYRDIAFKEYSRHKDNTKPTNYSNLAHDGVLSTCSRTNKTSNKPWWRLWLPRKELITGLVLITETEKLSNFKRFKVTVEEVANNITQESNTNNLTCYVYPDTSPPSKTIEVTCDQALVDNQVRITLDGTSTQLVICDIRVYGGKNLAFGKETSQSSYAGSSSDAALTVDGVITITSTACSKTTNQNEPWWQVDLKYIMNIQAVRIWTSSDSGLRYFRLQGRNVSNDKWSTLHDDAWNYYPTKNISVVTQARYLRVLIYERTVTLVICEVEVFGECPAGRWGPGCGFLCGNCLGPCSGQTGHCPQGCKDGYKNTLTCQTACNNGRYGSNCLGTCGHCRNGADCQTGNGSCSDGCAPGWQGDLCKEACADGKYGSSCVEPCGHCRDGVACQKDNGLCSNSCAAGWQGELCQDRCTSGRYGDNCSQACSDNCKGGNTNCNNVNGNCDLMCAAGWMGQKCDAECNVGKYGENCKNACGQCLNAPCDRVSGKCTDGCMAGYYKSQYCTAACNGGTYGIDCNESCSENCQSRLTCDKSDGKCECKTGWRGDTCGQACLNGTWNTGCKSECGYCLTGPCNRFNGLCSGGCQPGFKNASNCISECDKGSYGLNCKENCSNNCRDRWSCNKTDGKCDCKTGWSGATCEQACKNGTWGDNCSNECGHCLTGSCDRIAGICYGGCQPGYKNTSLCTEACDAGSYGQDCIHSCSEGCLNSTNCRKSDGHCENCTSGWKGNMCDQECENNEWGEGCSKVCGSCNGGNTCNQVNGTCGKGCMPGYKTTIFCIEECLDGTHGHNCTNACGNCDGGVTNCSKANGACALGCAEGFGGGETCTTKLPGKKDTPVPAIVGGIVAAIVVIAVVLAVLLFLRYRRRNIAKQNQFISNSENLTDVCRDYSHNEHDTKKSVRDKQPPNDNIYMNASVLTSLHDTGADGDTKTTSINSTLKSKQTGANENDCEYYNTSVQRDIPKTAIWLSNLREYIGSKASSNDIFHQQFITLPKGLVHPTTVALKPKNRPKNRYKEMYTYDHSRVILNTLPGQPDSDYINAAFINGQSLDKAYIAAQGPTKVNIVDFWRMIWEMNVTKVVMVTNVKEEGKDKCQKYWASKEQSSYGSLLVTVSSEEVMAEFTIRTFIVKSISQNKQRTITHYHFTAWPDKCTPKGLTGLVQFWSKVRKDDTDSTHPWLVHCSAGVGRTGTFIALDILYDQGKQLEYVDVYQCVRELRQQRVNMVQTQDQYRYLHEVVYEALILPSKAIPWCDFENEYRELLQVEKKTGVTLLNTQFETQGDFDHFSKEDIAGKEQSDEVTDVYAVAKLPENKNKNRYNNILASKDYRTFLSTHVPGCNNYINAVYIPSYRQLRGFILTQAPLEHTAIDCCRLFYDMDIEVVVAFDDTGTEEVGMYLPDQGSVEIGPFRVDLMSEDKRHYYTTKNYNMHYKEKEKRIKQILFTKWSRDETIPRDPEAILSLLHEVTEIQRQSNDSPILVQCLNGAERSGMFVVLMNVLERMRIEQEVAIPPVIRNLRQIRQQIIPNFEQYKFCHEIVLRHIQDNSTYANV